MNDISDHALRVHSLYSPSGYDRWSRCPASVLATKDIPREDSPASLLGTWKHEQAEKIFTGGSPDLHHEYATPDNLEAVMTAAQAARSIVDQAGLVNEPVVWIEEPVSGEGLGIPDIFGTPDLVIWDEDLGILHVLDYKFGGGLVHPRTPQLRLYALMAAVTHGVTPQEYRCTIIQPEAPELIATQVYTPQELTDWWAHEVAIAYFAASKEGALFHAGQVQCHWCPLKGGKCPAQIQHGADCIEAAEEALYRAPAVTPNYQELLQMADEMAEMAKQIYEKALQELLAGREIEGYYLAESSPHRKWRDEKTTLKWLAARKIPKEERFVTSVISPAGAERLLKATLKDNPRLQKTFQGLIEVPPGKPTIAKAGSGKPRFHKEDPLLDGMADDNQEDMEV